MFKYYSRIAEVYEQKEVTENWFTKSTFVRKYKNYKGHLKAQTIGASIDFEKSESNSCTKSELINY